MARWINTLGAVSCLIFMPAALGAPHGTVDGLATIIDNNFYDPAKAREIATQLRTEAQAGKFDGISDPRDLASALTRKLKAFDHHFNVTWTAKPASVRAQSGSTDAAPTAPAVQDRRSSYGFRSVEMRPGALGYIDMRFFADFSFNKPDEPARRAADAALQLISGADAVIIDLRYNGGGSPAMVGYLVSAFTPRDADIYNVFRRRDGTDSERPKEAVRSPAPRCAALRAHQRTQRFGCRVRCVHASSGTSCHSRW